MVMFYTLLSSGCSTLFFIDEFSLKNSEPLQKHVFYTIEFLQIVWWVFIKRTKLQSIFLNKDNTYVKVLILNIPFVTESTERRKTSFLKE